MATCDHPYTHTTIKVVDRDDGSGPHELLNVTVYCLLCGKTGAITSDSKLLSRLPTLRDALPELDQILFSFNIARDDTILDA